MRNRVRLAMLLFISNGLALLLAAGAISELFLVAILVLLAICGWYVLSLRCPHCGNPVVHNPTNFLGVRMWMYTPWVPDQCSRCSNPLP
jgi:hypothetical protein